MKKLIVLVGPPGSGKSTYSHELEKQGYVRISQDDQGKDKHHKLFAEALQNKQNIVVDRMNFSKHQRDKYLMPAKMIGAGTEVVVFHVPRAVCFERIMARENHPTINGKIDVAPNDQYQMIDLLNKEEVTRAMEKRRELQEKINTEKARQANSALDTFFTKYERVTDDEADKVTRLGWVEHTGKTKPAVICDLDGTLADLSHRLHYVKNENKKLNRWDLFEKEVGKDGLHEWCKILINQMQNNYPIIFCSGRNENARKDTEEWLLKYGFEFTYGTDNKERGKHYRHLFMRHRNDYRQDYIIKEIILDFEILPRYSVLFAVDDRQQVVDMWRRRGIVCLQCAEGDF